MPLHPDLLAQFQIEGDLQSSLRVSHRILIKAACTNTSEISAINTSGTIEIEKNDNNNSYQSAHLTSGNSLPLDIKSMNEHNPVSELILILIKVGML